MPPDELQALKNEVMEMKLSVNDLENKVEHLADVVSKLTKTLEDRAKEDAETAKIRIEKAKEWTKLKTEHEACKERHANESAFLTGRFGNIIDKILPVIIGAACMYLYTKKG